MKRGDHIILKRGKTRRILCRLLHDHSVDEPSFPALTIEKGNETWIVGINEVITPEQMKAEAEAERKAKEDSVAEIVAAFKAGNDTMRKLATAMGKQMIDVLSKARKAQRMGLIKLTKETNEKKQTSKSKQVPQVPGL